MNTKAILTLAFAGLLAATSIADPLGVTVNNIMLDDTGPFNGTGWVYDPDTGILRLDGASPVTLSGTNGEGRVRVLVSTNVTAKVTLSNLTLGTDSANQCVFTLETNACVSLFLAGWSSLWSGDNRAGLEVTGGRTLCITNAPGDDAAGLLVTGGDYGAGIGGYKNSASGTLKVSGGTIVSTGGDRATGIGGGHQGAGGVVTINGGQVTTTGGDYAAGIGGGDRGNGGKVSIKIINAQKDVYYTLYATAALGGDWTKVGTSICALTDGDLVFENIDATPPCRFFKVKASTDQL